MSSTTHEDKRAHFDAVIAGSGISGLTAAYCLNNSRKIIVLEKQSSIGGLIRCKDIEGSLYHLVGGHVFNSKIPRIHDFFWGSVFDKRSFVASTRNASISIEGRHIRYPIENNLKQLGAEHVKAIVNELLEISTRKPEPINSFGEFLRSRFGQILCDIYFFPYNRKIWCHDPDEMALDWLEGKLPMPSVSEIITSNILNEEDTRMVHSSFFYPREKGSQYIINRLADGIDIKTESPLQKVLHLEHEGLLLINDEYLAKSIIYTGTIKDLPRILPSGTLRKHQEEQILNLKSHGTTNVLCVCKKTEYSWIYFPEKHLKAHRIIHTGSFATCNTSTVLREKGLSTCVVEFSGFLDECAARKEAESLPGILSVISYNHCPSTYIIQDSSTRTLIRDIKERLKVLGIHLTGRFAEWEYYNMDTAMDAAISIAEYVLEKTASKK
jgi:protoporphyrinogen oxidase